MGTIIRTTLWAALLGATAASAGAQVTLTVPAQLADSTVKARYVMLGNLVDAKTREDIKVKEAEVKADGNTFTFNIDPTGSAQYMVTFGETQMPIIYTAPGQKIRVDITSVSPMAYTAEGSQLMEGVSYIDNLLKPYVERQPSPPCSSSARVRSFSTASTCWGAVPARACSMPWRASASPTLGRAWPSSAACSR